MKRCSLAILLLVGCSTMEPHPELSGVWFDGLLLNGLRSEWTLALEEIDGHIDGRYRVLDLHHGVFPIEGGVRGDYAHPHVTLALNIYKQHPLACDFRGTVSRDFQVLDGMLRCYNSSNTLVYGAPMYFERLKGLD